MLRNLRKGWVLAGVLGVLLPALGQAALIDQGDGTVLDDTTNLVWLQNWNVNGLANWDTQMSWADGLDFAGSTDWRLPSIDEYVALFGEYGDLTSVTQFTNVQSSNYWSGTEFSPSGAWRFSPASAFQGSSDKGGALYAVAVRSGDVGAQEVSEPGMLALFGMGLLGLLFLGRARRPLRLW